MDEVTRLQKPLVVSSTGHKCRYRLILSTKAVQGTSLPLEGIDHIHGGDSIPLGVLSVGDSIADDIPQEALENTPSLLVNESTDPFDAPPPCKSADRRLGDALDVISQHLAMPLSTTLPQTFSSFASTSHGCYSEVWTD